MRRLVGGVPRAYANHRVGAGRRYAELCRQDAARFPDGQIPKDARLIVKLKNRLLIDYDQVVSEQQRAIARRRQRDVRRFRRVLAGMSRELLTLNEKLDALVAAAVPADGLAALVLQRAR